ncbi:uncharacterized protein LOC117581632 isoform X2 [Drosophila guanche]|uniref:uncharacterized protein LOC117581632 isoform X2 n=1 Tax=Drosophila guanche TaxID=7266 RepID=UPI0014723F3E|nr:uncharacterized protein LOC117581632 isoform X2 [Drosophila guanche]
MSKFGYGNLAMLKFLEAYKEQPLLYDPTVDNYRNRMAREKAYAAMIEKFNFPNILIEDVKRKIKIIRTVYTKELGIRRCFEEMGKPYETKLKWFSMADTFLRKVSNSHPKNWITPRRRRTSRAKAHPLSDLQELNYPAPFSRIRNGRTIHQHQQHYNH